MTELPTLYRIHTLMNLLSFAEEALDVGVRKPALRIICQLGNLLGTKEGSHPPPCRSGGRNELPASAASTPTPDRNGEHQHQQRRQDGEPPQTENRHIPTEAPQCLASQ